MSDLFQDDVPTDYIECVFEVMRRADLHQYQLLTKRSERVRELSKELPWAPQIWMGVSVENEKYAFRIDDLKKPVHQIPPARHRLGNCGR
jgi:protein gp37